MNLSRLCIIVSSINNPISKIMHTSYSPQLNTAANTALLAGKSIMRFYSRLENLKIMSKGFNDYVSEADQESEKIITQALLKSYPDYKITAEESGSNNTESEYEWFIDPLDGTTNFLHGIPQFAVSIGLCKNKVPILGVVYDFNHDDMYSGSKNHQASLNGIDIKVSQIKDKSLATIVTGLPAKTDFSEKAMNKMITDFQSWKKVRMIGSAAMASVYVASGKADLYKEFGIY